MVDGYSHLFQKHAGKFVRVLERHIDGDEFDVMPYLHDSIFETTMGKQTIFVLRQNFDQKFQICFWRMKIVTQ